MQCAYLLKIRRESHLQNAVSSQQSTLTLTKRLNSIYSKLTSKYVILTNHTILDQQAAGSCVKLRASSSDILLVLWVIVTLGPV